MTEISKTRLLSLLDPYLKEFQATAIATLITEGADTLILDQTFFHPQGGGQDSDTGLFAWSKGSAEVVAVKEFGGVIHHILRNMKGTINAGDLIKGTISWERRYGLMRHHTASHILWATFEKVLPKMEIIGSAVMADKGRFDIRTDREQLIKKLEEIEATANKIVKENQQVKISMLTREEALCVITKYGASPSILPKGIDSIRIVEIGGWDISACKGLHVKTTGEVGGIKILGRTSKGKNVDRLEFAAV